MLNKVAKKKLKILLFNKKKTFSKTESGKGSNMLVTIPSKVEQILTGKEFARILSIISTQGTGMLKIQYIIPTNVAG